MGIDHTELMRTLRSDNRVEAGLAYIEEDNEFTTAEQIELTEVEAPTFEEKVKGELYKKKLSELGIEDIRTDEVGNVFGIRKGSGDGPSLVLCAHLDTVFPAGTDVKAKWKDGKVYAPGISDDGRGLAAVLSVVRALNHSEIRTEGDLIVGATVGEEGLGDLRGVKHLFETSSGIDGFISIEPGSPERVTYLGTGSKRYRVTYRGPGGHSFGNYGTASPIHAMGRAIAAISQIRTEEDPKTTLNVGVIGGGTSVNTIAETAEMLVDIRSNSQEELEKLEAHVLDLIRSAATAENEFREHPGQVTVELERVGNRPAGSQSADAPIVQAAAAASEALGFEPILDQASSTDSNVPIHLGIPAVTLGGGGDFGGCHTLNEYFDPEGAFVGVQKIFLTVLALAGIEGTVEPVLEVRKKKSEV
ncbi:Acetylornithine deacetylase/Succinyl-diaminopimelate desuccinylase [Bhargavaea ginsengi]|uniref:Acetylornithine deacetylase/Succinyl-diaminopimelate desuccinylase n=1 Tax=Bhargavaea ginsengi TaxID=426757 RepID=A0A1H6UPW7_9BACL|nr:M20/M25/M40 family metallo-hydrolase [Bhargavaea ginsengi]SEI89932.1 Acetylornithine deacetylase/Succinyl-diaminopimelate desuccinylase [Bhargavaea ginsengi]